MVESQIALLFYGALEDSNDNKENWLTIDEAEKKGTVLLYHLL